MGIFLREPPAAGRCLASMKTQVQTPSPHMEIQAWGHLLVPELRRKDHCDLLENYGPAKERWLLRNCTQGCLWCPHAKALTRNTKTIKKEEPQNRQVLSPQPVTSEVLKITPARAPTKQGRELRKTERHRGLGASGSYPAPSLHTRDLHPPRVTRGTHVSAFHRLPSPVLPCNPAVAHSAHSDAGLCHMVGFGDC